MAIDLNPGAFAEHFDRRFRTGSPHADAEPESALILEGTIVLRHAAIEVDAQIRHRPILAIDLDGAKHGRLTEVADARKLIAHALDSWGMPLFAMSHRCPIFRPMTTQNRSFAGDRFPLLEPVSMYQGGREGG
ncbi:hypothetical protein [Methylocaldum sp. RMAD-M]|uniref:hypothetical protein n=1 Tax=Methylocaldum sp. RMAD-M TaxID=2806557 RepID=UPI001B59F0F5|nr:hypothetical protein [Methylocaldum sp. RMAD-M]MBP1149542.1 hypothetical protein [Methylocaldum sp. RMAD-M]